MRGHGAPRERGWAGAVGRAQLGLLRLAVAGLLLPAASCSWSAAASTGCAPASENLALPAGLEEASGAAPSAYGAGAIWTHDDSGDDPRLVAVDTGGRSLAILRPTPIRRVDWEALERADCRSGRCIWIADTGDNQERRQNATLYRLPEPDPAGDDAGPEEVELSARAVAFPVEFPDGPRDVEALFVLPGQRVHLVTKGRNDPVTVYRYPLPLRPGERVTLEPVQQLTDEPALLPDQVTGAAAGPDGTAVVVRTYRALTFYRVGAGVSEGGPPDGAAGGDGGALLQPLPGGSVDLTSLREAQGEGVAWLEGDRLALVSEAGPGGSRGGLRLLECEIGTR